MQNRVLEQGMPARSGILYPLLIIAAVLMIAFNVYCMTMITSLVPRTESINQPNGIAQSSVRVEGNAGNNCSDCGGVEVVKKIQIKG